MTNTFDIPQIKYFIEQKDIYNKWHVICSDDWINYKNKNKIYKRTINNPETIIDKKQIFLYRELLKICQKQLTENISEHAKDIIEFHSEVILYTGFINGNVLEKEHKKENKPYYIDIWLKAVLETKKIYANKAISNPSFQDNKLIYSQNPHQKMDIEFINKNLQNIDEPQNWRIIFYILK